MYPELRKICSRPKVFESYTAELLWNDEHISKQMLDYHLNENVDLASRNTGFIDGSVQWLISRFNIGDKTRIADFGCGPGLYTNRFVEKGAVVTGIDFSERSIQYAKTQAEKKGLDVEYVLKNYLDFTTDKQFDLITMIFCDFCPLNPAQRKIMLDKYYGLLCDGGMLFLDVVSLNSFDIRQETSSFEHLLMDGFWSADDYYGFLNTYKYEEEKVILDKYTIVEQNRTWEVFNWLQYFSREAITKEFEDSGFRVMDYYSDVAGAPYTDDSPEIALVAKKV